MVTRSWRIESRAVTVPAVAARESLLWSEARRIPSTVADTLQRADGFEGVGRLLTAPTTRRIVVTGNGASFYAGHALWLASLAAPAPAEVVAIPGGLLATGSFRWRKGDVMLALSSSGEFRDVLEAVERDAPEPFALVTAHLDSTLGRAAAVSALVRVETQCALTHTQGYCGAVAALLAVWAEVSADERLAAAVATLPDALDRELAEAARWASEAEIELPSAAVAFGSGPGWSAALEAALLLKEVAGVPAEGVETREAATSSMYALAPGHLVVSLPAARDLVAEDAERICAGRGARVVRTPRTRDYDARLVAVSTFPAALALAISLARARGFDPDSPGWANAYLATARRGDQSLSAVIGGEGSSTPNSTSSQ